MSLFSEIIYLTLHIKFLIHHFILNSFVTEKKVFENFRDLLSILFHHRQLP